ncbi:Mettl26 [Scenedesmus sp. PABB004]|nr:Mettl26 [Scenedesmus sp. PABB004]
MASTLNAFDLLNQAGQVNLNAAKKKKKNKPKAKADGDAAPGGSDGGAPAAAAAAAAAAEAPAAEGSVVVEQGEACAVLEKSARTFKSGGDRIKLWKDWVKQAGDRGGKALKYRADDGSLIQFKELMLRSRALEITVEGCVTSALTAEQAANLQQLVAAFIPRVDPAALASAVTRLAQLLAEDTQSFDTIGAAQRAVHNVVATLKAGRDGAAHATAKPASLQERLAAIDRDAAKAHGFLASVEKLLVPADPTKPRVTGQSSGITKAHVDSARELAKLYGTKFDLLRPGGGAGAAAARAGAGGATVRALEELKGIISNHLQEARSIEESVKGAAGSKEAQRAQAVAALRREEGVLAAQASEINGQIRQLESQLAQLRGQAAEVEDKRVRLQQRQAAALEALHSASGRKVSGLSAQHYNNELAATDSLLALVDPSSVSVGAGQLAAAQEEHGDAAQAYMASVRNLLQMSSSSLADVPSKVVFCRQRIAQAEKLGSLGGPNKERSAKQRDDSERMLAETVKHCEEMLAGATSALEGMRGRFPAFTPEQQAALSTAAYEVEDMMSHIRGQYELAMAAVRGQAPAGGAGGPPTGPYAPGGAPPVPAPGAFGPPGGGRPPAGGGGGLGPITPPPAPAGAPGPVGPAPASNGAPTAPAAPAAAPAPPRPRPASAAEAAKMPPADGFQQRAATAGRLAARRSLRVVGSLRLAPISMASAGGYGWDAWQRGGDAAAQTVVSPSAERNKQPILEELRRQLPPDAEGLVLEVASGTGQHVAHFAAGLSPALRWQPSDVTSELFASIAGYAAALPNVLPPLVLDAAAPPETWPLRAPASCAAVLACNLTHISPWRVTLGLVAGAGRLLRAGGRLLIYGPFKVDGGFTTESNRSFDETLRAQDPEWGYRDVADISAAATAAGLVPAAGCSCVRMPANNFLLVYVKQGG